MPLRLVRRWLSPQFNSLWAGTPILTLPLKARAERQLGINSKSLVYETYGIAKGGFDFNLMEWTRKRVIGQLVPLFVFFYALATQDRLHFFCDRGLTPVFKRGRVNWFELAAYRFLGIQLFFWTYGADVRTRESTIALGKTNCCSFCPRVGLACVCSTEKASDNYAVIAKYATKVFAMGDMIHYTPGSKNDVFYWPIDLEAQSGVKYAPVYPDLTSTRPIKIVHAANHRMFKGTDFLVKAIEEIRQEGWSVELKLVENLSNELSLEIYKSADIIFDQCLIGFHGYFALEGMALGKPVMSFLRYPKDYVLAPDECPIVNTSIITLKDDILSLCKDRKLLNQLGLNGRSYIERHYTIAAVSKRFGDAYNELGFQEYRD